MKIKVDKEGHEAISWMCDAILKGYGDKVVDTVYIIKHSVEELKEDDKKPKKVSKKEAEK